MLLCALAAGFATLLFGLAYAALSRLLQLPEVGTFLATRLLSMVLLAASSMLIFSSLIVALSSLFLSPELERLVAAPVPRSRLILSRLVETGFDAAWMVLVFACPLLCAYGAAHGEPLAFYAGLLALLPPFVAIPVIVGSVLTAFLVRVFPARRTRDVLALLMVVGGAVLYVALRLLQPERFLRPEGFASFVDFVRALQLPSLAFLPSQWAVEVLTAGQDSNTRLFFLALLWSTAAAFLVLAELGLRYLQPIGLAKAQEGRATGGVRASLLDAGLRRLPLAESLRLLIGRELKTFLRDTAQWSQLVLLGALVVVYVYNFQVIPSIASPVLTFYLKNIIAFANLALAAFVIASVAARFVLPSISLEGRAFWIARTAPLAPRQIWWSKLVVGLAPLFVVAEALVMLTNSYLGVASSLRWLSTLTIAGLTPGIVTLALAVGSAHVRFDVTDPAKIAGGVPGLFFMLLSATFILAVATLEAWPTYLLFTVHIEERTLSAMELALLLLSLGLATALILAVPTLAAAYGIRRLEALEA